LIDEAVTPLIISAPQKNELLEKAVLTARDIVRGRSNRKKITG